MTTRRSLKQIMLAYAVACLVLVTAMGLLSGAGLYYWRQSAQESERINSVLGEVRELRGGLYRLIKEVFDAAFLDDPEAPAQYAGYVTEVEQHFAIVEGLPRGDQERSALEGLRKAYLEVKRQTDSLMANPRQARGGQGTQLLDRRLELDALQNFEAAFRAAETIFADRQQALIMRLDRLTWLGPPLLMLPVIGAVFLLALSGMFARRVIGRPLMGLLSGAAAFRRGDLDHRVAEQGAEELANISRALNDMAADLAQSRAALVKAERQAALGALVPVVAHNIRNPLASIRATAQVIDEPALGNDLRQGLKDIIHTTDRLALWTGALLSYLSPLKPQLAGASLTQAADHALQLLASAIAAKRIAVSKDGWDGAARAGIDMHLVEQALHGLLLNAIDASSAGGELRLAVSATDDEVMLAITDRGPGMPFTPAAGDLSPGPSTKRYGTGLGIPFAFRVCEAHGGSLRFLAAVGGGTRVEIAFPKEKMNESATSD